MPQVTNVLLIRHGQSKGNAERRFGGHTATPLSARGRRQAELTARVLKSESLTAIYSSDLARAMETARPLANLTGLTVKGTSAFRERSVGVMEGLTFEDAAQQHPEQYAALLRRESWSHGECIRSGWTEGACIKLDFRITGAIAGG